MSSYTAFLLIAQYSGKAIIPLNDVCRDYSSHLTLEIELPFVRIESSQKST